MSRDRPFAARRQELGLCLQRAAARLRISAKYLRALERGQVPLSYSLARRMAVEYSTTVDLLTRTAGRDRAGSTGDGLKANGNAFSPQRSS
ncbi:MAG: helix-turn-helix domain-containing protein [Armatimonadota bacterium]